MDERGDRGVSLTCPYCHQPFTLFAVSIPAAAAATTVPEPTPTTPWLCPVHRTSKIVPAGTSRATGKTYTAFWACTERDCQQRPPRGYPVPLGVPASVSDPLPDGLEELI